jgi:hypothetical protein
MKTYKINTKTKHAHTDAWRGYEQPTNAIAGANNTGNFSDSPCPENVCLSELDQVKKIMIQNNIPYKLVWCGSSNVFCMRGYIVVPGLLKRRAKKLIAHLPENTQLLYLC